MTYARNPYSANPLASGRVTRPPEWLDIPYRYASGATRTSLRELRLEDQIFSFRDAEKSEWVHFHVGALWKLIIAKPDDYEQWSVRLVEADMRTIVRDRGIENDHLDRMEPGLLNTPGILCLMPDGSSIIVDGNHRYVRRWRDGLREMDFWNLTFEQCKPSVLNVRTDLMTYLEARYRALRR